MTGSYQFSEQNEEQDLACDQVLQLLYKSIEAAEKIEELQGNRLQQCEQEERRKEEDMRLAMERQEKMLDEYKSRHLKRLKEAAAEKQRCRKEQQDTVLAQHNEEFLRQQEASRKQQEEKGHVNDFDLKQVSEEHLRRDWRRQMEEELNKIDRAKQDLMEEKKRQEDIVRQKIEEELNKIAVENTLKEFERDDLGRACKDGAWVSVGTAKKEVKKKRTSNSLAINTPSTPFKFLTEKLLTQPSEPVQIKSETTQNKPKTTKKWAIPTQVLQTSSEPTPSEANAKSPSGHIEFHKKHKKKKREKHQEMSLDPSLLLHINVVSDPDRVNAGEIDKMPPMPSKRKKKKR